MIWKIFHLPMYKFYERLGQDRDENYIENGITLQVGLLPVRDTRSLDVFQAKIFGISCGVFDPPKTRVRSTKTS